MQSYIDIVIVAYLINLSYFNWKVEFFMECYPFHFRIHLRFNLAWDASTLALRDKVKICSAWKRALLNTFFFFATHSVQLWREHKEWEWSFFLVWQRIIRVDANIFFFRIERIGSSPHPVWMPARWTCHTVKQNCNWGGFTCFE